MSNIKQDKTDMLLLTSIDIDIRNNQYLNIKELTYCSNPRVCLVENLLCQNGGDDPKIHRADRENQPSSSRIK